MNEVLDHWSFFEPDFYLDLLKHDGELPKEWMQLFYIARCIFSSWSDFPIKGALAPLLERSAVFSKESLHSQDTRDGELVVLNLAEALDIGKINSLDQISYILPREFIINIEEAFYKKLLNHELCRKVFEGPDALSVSDLVYGRENELNRRQKVYILFDNSSSMNGDRYNKLYAAKAICLEYLRRIQKECPQIYFRSFNQAVSPLIWVRKPSQVKGLIRHIIDLTTDECYETRLGDAILTAVDDIKSDPDFKQAEILMVTDGLGDIPNQVEERLRGIKFHTILISGIDMDSFLESYPDKASWEKANPNVGSKKIPSYWETFLKITQVYRLQDISDIFVRLPSSYIRGFKSTNMEELEFIRRAREDFAQKIAGAPSNNKKFEIFQRIRFFSQYLTVMLTHENSRELCRRIKEELRGFNALMNGLKENEWFACTLKNQGIERQRKLVKGNLKGYTLKRSNPSFIRLVLASLSSVLFFLPRVIIHKSSIVLTMMSGFLSCTSRRHRLRMSLRHIDNKISQVVIH